MGAISTWLASIGIDPLLAGLVLGALLALLLTRGRRSADLTMGTGQVTSIRTREIEIGGAGMAIKLDGNSIDLPPKLGEEIVQHLRTGNKIAAIKALREATGVGLAEAKHLVEMLENSDPMG